MPWRDPQHPREFPTLGYLVANWIEERCAIPDREFVGDPYLLTDEQLRFLFFFYRLDPITGRFAYNRGAQLTRPQKWGKGPFSAAIICAEAQGPVRFSHWDEDGEPVGKPVPTPLIQVTAVSEEQTDNVYSALLPMIELGALHGEIEDTGLGRINLPSGGKIEPVTASGLSRLGQRTTFIVQDQTESWLSTNGGRRLADNQRRNIAGMDGRWLSTNNAWDPAEESVAQYTSENERKGVYHDDVDPAENLSIRNKAERRRALRTVYGGSVTGRRGEKNGVVKPWINLDRIEDEILALLPRDPAQAERFFLNRKRAAESAAFDLGVWDAQETDYHPEPGAFITLGVDGARFADAIGVVATEIATGHQWLVGLWERPESASDDYEHSFHEVDGAVSEAVDELFNVWRIYIDPGSHNANIQHLSDEWLGRWGKERVITWLANRPKQISMAVASYSEGMAGGDLSHPADPDFRRHIANAVRQKVNVFDERHRQMHTISKDRPDSSRKMDAAMAAVLSWEARGDAIAAGAEPEKPGQVWFG